MNPTRTSLLLRVKDPRDDAAWREFHELYAPLLYAYARARGLNHDDAEDVRSTCLEALVRQLPTFQYEKARGGFKAWLRTMVQRRVVDLLRRRHDRPAESQDLEQIADRDPPPDDLWEKSWRQRHLAYCVERVRLQVPDATYRAFRMLLDENLPVPDICSKLQITANQVYKAKARVLELVRQEMALLDPDSE